MNIKSIALKFLPHLAAILVFVVVANVFFSMIGNGYTIKQHDIQNVMGMAKEIQDYRLMNDGQEPLWAGNMFAGMPAYQTTVIYSTNILRTIDKVAKFGMAPAIGTLYMCMLGFYIFALCLRINPWLGIAGGVAFGLATINILYLGGGHTSKINALSYIAPTIGALVMTYRGRWLFGSALFALFFGLGLTSNHFQMTYYLAFLVALVGLGEIIHLIIKKQLIYALKASGMLAVAAIIGLLPNVGNLLTTYEYSKYTTRGSSELTIKADANNTMAPDQDGLSDEYILNYNMSAGEPWSMIIPNAKGGSSQVSIDKNKDAYGQADKTVKEQLKNFPIYWGGQGSSAGAFYFGAAVIFLFFMAFVFSKDNMRWAFLAMTLLSIALCMRDLHTVNDLFINHFPMYNKFRDSKMILVLIQFMAPALALIWIQEMIDQPQSISKKPMFIGLGIGLILLIGVTAKPSITGDLISQNEKEYFEELTQQYKGETQTLSMIGDIEENLIKVRTFVFRQDAQRSILIVLVAIATVILLAMGKLKKYPAIALLGVLFIADIWTVSARYMNEEKELVAENKREFKHYAPVDEMVFPFQPDATDLAILEAEKGQIKDYDAQVNQLKNALSSKAPYNEVKNKELIQMSAQFGVLQLNTNYRVLFATPGTMSESRTAYFHKSLGGYHAAKLKSYQELYDFYINKEIVQIQESLKTQNMAAIDSTIGLCQIIHLLNTKYIKINGNGRPLPNTERAFGNAWFVNKVDTYESADEVMTALGTTDLKSTAVVMSKDAKDLPLQVAIDSTYQIKMTAYATNKITYQSENAQDAVVVFSEIYYPEGWVCRIDGQDQAYFKCDHALRAAKIPAGKHEITWSFEPKSFNDSTAVNTAGSILLILLLIGASILEVRSAIADK
jgi:Bacterial membrane protein YfhO